MTPRTALRWGAALALVVVVTPADSTPPAQVSCAVVAASPNIARDGTAVCAALRNTGSSLEVVVYRSLDRGRTWTRAEATGLPSSTTAYELDPVFSPRYADDHMLLLATPTGLFVSTDVARTFQLVDGMVTARSTGNPGYYVAELSGPAGNLLPGARLLAARGAGRTSSRSDVTTGARLVVVGNGRGTTQEFVISPAPNQMPIAMSYEYDVPVDESTRRATTWLCDRDLTCTTRGFQFPVRMSVQRFWWVSQPAGPPALGALGMRDGKTYQVWLSRDGGTTFDRWASVEALFASASATGSSVPQVGFAAVGRGRNYLRVQAQRADNAMWHRSAPPAEQVFRTDDGGRTWRRVGFQRGLGQRGAHGNLPWNQPPFGPNAPAAITATPDGRLLVAAGNFDERTSAETTSVYCSLDGGVRWYRTCPR